jgi:hypothetical protein
MAPGVLTNQSLQNVSFYKSLRALINMSAAGGLATLGTVATTLPDGSPATFQQGNMDVSIVRIKPNGSSLNLPNEWVAGGGESQIAHGLGRVPIGYWIVRKSRDVDVYDGTTAWTSTYVYLHTIHSDADTTMMFF